MTNIGIIDSGVGGLSVLQELHALMPEAALHYIADSAWCPYGPRPVSEIQERTAALTDHLLANGSEIVVIACNSATISAIGYLRTLYPVPFVGMEPAVKPAAQLTRSGTIGIMATEASLAGEKFHKLINTHAGGLKVITRPCPEFVRLVESGELKGATVDAIVEKHTLPLLEAEADVLVLGCSHYPFLRPVIQKVAGDHIQVIDTGTPVAQRVLNQITSENIVINQGPVLIETTGDLDELKRLLPTLCPNLKSQISSLSLSSVSRGKALCQSSP